MSSNFSIYSKEFYYFFRLIISQWHLIVSMARREVQNTYIGSGLGIIWTFIHPLVMITVFWVIFSVGFKVKPTNNVPFAVWLTAGMCAWLVFADIVNGASNIIIAHSHLIKKTLFQSSILPIVKILSSLIMHFIFLLILTALLIFQHLPLSFYFFQFIYYLFAMSVLALGLSWIVSSLNVFIRDVGQIVSVVMQVGFWATPIFWDINIMPEKIQSILKLNPMFYIVEGYRESFIYFSPFWKKPYYSLYFWFFSIITLFVGAVIFKKLKPHFADVL